MKINPKVEDRLTFGLAQKISEINAFECAKYHTIPYGVQKIIKAYGAIHLHICHLHIDRMIELDSVRAREREIERKKTSE